MRTWSKTDIAGLFFVLFGIVSFLFSNSNVLVMISFALAAFILLHGIYNARYDCAKYKEILCHYQAILSSSEEGWIAWNIDCEYIGSSKKIKTFFEIKQSSNIRISDIVAAIEPIDAEFLSLHFSKLKKQGTNFVFSVKTLIGKSKIQVTGSRMIINNVETLVLWCVNVTESSALTISLEQKLNATKQKAESFAEIFNVLQIPVWRRDGNLKIVYCNRAYSNYLNCSVEKVLDGNIPLASGNFPGQGYSLTEHTKKTGRHQAVPCFIVVNGVKRKLLLNEYPTAGGGLVGYASDLTAEESLTSDLNKAIAANREVLENLSVAVVIFGENMRVNFFNDAYKHFMKLDHEWLKSGPSYGEVLDELRNNRLLSEQADYPGYKKAQLALFASVTEPTHEFIYLPNGKTLKLTISPYQFGGLLYMYEDVSDSLMLQRKNNMLLAVHKETINNLYEGITVYGSDNRLKIINNAMQKIWKTADEKSSESMIGSHISEMLDSIKDEIDCDSDWEDFRENAVSNLTDRIPKTGKIFKKDNSVIQFSYIPLPDGAHLHSFTDVTDTFVVERAVTEKNEALKTAWQMRKEFISGISVELKDPLSVLIGFSELLLSRNYGILNDRQEKYCRCILDASNQMHQLTGNLLEMVSIDVDSTDLDLSLFSLQDAIDEIIQSLEKRILEKNIELVKNYPEHRVEFLGDRTRIKQSVYNILITVLQNTMIHGKIDVIIIVDSENLKIVVKDDSIVIDKNKPARKFFHRSSKILHFGNGESEGISMPLVKSLIELHGGTLKINSHIGEGTSFVCTLPMKLPKDNVLKMPKSVLSRVVNN